MPKMRRDVVLVAPHDEVEVAFGFGSLLAAPKLRCNGCGTYLKPGNSASATPALTPYQQRVAKRAAKRGAEVAAKCASDPEYVARIMAKRGLVDDPEQREYEARQAATQARYEAKLASQPTSEPDEIETAEPQGDPLDQLRKLGELRDLGVLTGDEFEAKKTELLTRL
jgi:hypothetical protein